MTELLTILADVPNYPLVRWIIYGCLWIGLVPFFLWVKYVYSTKNWPSVTGTILYSEVEGQGSSKAKTRYILKLEFVYSVNSEKYTGNRRRYLDVVGNHRIALDEFVDAHPKGTQVDVYYNPKKPKVSVLIPGVVFSGIALLSLFFFMAIFINSIPLVSALLKAGYFS